MTRDRLWRDMVCDMKTEILSQTNGTQQNSLETLTELFIYCTGEYDDSLKNKLPQLHNLLEDFCTKTPSNDTELLNNSRELLKFFVGNKEKIKSLDTQLFFALLNFADMLKSKGLYFKIISTETVSA